MVSKVHWVSAWDGMLVSHPLLELLVDSIQCILDRDAFEVPCCYLETEGEVKVNLLNWRCCEHLLEVLLVVYRCRRRVDLPACRESEAWQLGNDEITYHPSLWVSLAIESSTP